MKSSIVLPRVVLVPPASARLRRGKSLTPGYSLKPQTGFSGGVPAVLDRPQHRDTLCGLRDSEQAMSNDNSNPWTRRRFLTRGALAASAVALPCYIPASALGRGGAVAPSERIVMGGIGLGGRGSYDLGCMLAEREV